MCLTKIWWAGLNFYSSPPIQAQGCGNSGAGRRRSAGRAFSTSCIEGFKALKLSPEKIPSNKQASAPPEHASETDELEELYAQIGYRFLNPGLLQEALTHASLASARASNERLEFLGDRVLGLVVAEALCATFPNANEGELALRLNALVRQETCAQVAREAGLGQSLKLARSENEGGGREKPAILADAVEAVIGALFIDGGLKAARTFIERYWIPMLGNHAHARRDAKTILQEWAQGKGHGIPAYVVIERMGPDHAPEFTVEVKLKNFAPAQARGNSKRIAEQAAAAVFLAQAGVQTAL